MQIRLKKIGPIFKKRLKNPLNPWCVAAIIGLLGTWIAGTKIEHTGTGIMSQALNVAITPMTGIITLLWGATLFWWYKDITTRAKAYTLASRNKSDFLTLDDWGVTWGIEDVTSTKVAWAAIGFYRLGKSQLELGLPSQSIEIPIDEIEGASIDELKSLLQMRGIKKV